MKTPLITVVTTCSKRYIYQSLKAYRKELEILQQVYPLADILVVVNGNKDANEAVTKAVVAADVKRIIQIDQPGKNNAINRAVSYAKHNGFDVIHLLDDDVELTQGSVLKNIATLYETQKKFGSKILVSGSHCKVFPDRLPKTLGKRYFRSLFSIPYNSSINEIPAVPGQSICFFTNAVPKIPLNVADDAFLCQWAVKGKLGARAIVKPSESVVFFEPAHSLTAWYKQQLRLVRSNIIVDEMLKSGHYFSHKFSYMRKYRLPLKGTPSKYMLKAIILRFLLTLVEFHARSLLKNKKDMPWSTVEESKPHKYRMRNIYD